MAADDRAGDDPIIIKKYANRRLYNTRSSSYITLDDLARDDPRGRPISRCSTPRPAPTSPTRS